MEIMLAAFIQSNWLFSHWFSHTWNMHLLHLCRCCRPIMTKPKPAAPETPPPAPQGSEQQGDASAASNASASPNGKAADETEVSSASTEPMDMEKPEPTSAA